jgi:hypothetical protein
VSLKRVAERMRLLFDDARDACGPTSVEAAVDHDDPVRPRDRSRAASGDDRRHPWPRRRDDIDEEEDEDDDDEEDEVSCDDEDEIELSSEDNDETEGTTRFPFTLLRRGEPAEEWGMSVGGGGPGADGVGQVANYEDYDQVADYEDDDEDDRDDALEESIEVYGEDELYGESDDDDDELNNDHNNDQDADEDEDRGFNARRRLRRDDDDGQDDAARLEYDPLLAPLFDESASDTSEADEFRVVFHHRT